MLSNTASMGSCCNRLAEKLLRRWYQTGAAAVVLVLLRTTWQKCHILRKQQRKKGRSLPSDALQKGINHHKIICRSCQAEPLLAKKLFMRWQMLQSMVIVHIQILFWGTSSSLLLNLYVGSSMPNTVLQVTLSPEHIICFLSVSRVAVILTKNSQ